MYGCRLLFDCAIILINYNLIRFITLVSEIVLVATILNLTHTVVNFTVKCEKHVARGKLDWLFLVIDIFQLLTLTARFDRTFSG